jgi:hypothetical protein
MYCLSHGDGVSSHPWFRPEEQGARELRFIPPRGFQLSSPTDSAPRLYNARLGQGSDLKRLGNQAFD